MSTIAEILFTDDVSEMRNLAAEYQFSQGPVGDLARYLNYALDDRNRLMSIMGASGHGPCIQAVETRLRSRCDTREYLRMRAHRPTLPDPGGRSLAARRRYVEALDRDGEET